jgi:hypothetical protein
VRRILERTLVVLLWFVLLAWVALAPLWALEEAFGAAREASVAQVERRILTAFRSSPDPHRAVRIARCESRTERRQLDPRAVGDAGERGLFQIHPGHWSGSRPWTPWIAAIVHKHGRDILFDVDTNIRIAFRMSGGGRRWTPWTCARKVG